MPALLGIRNRHSTKEMALLYQKPLDKKYPLLAIILSLTWRLLKYQFCLKLA